jgi:hypothetical protein
MTEQEWLACTDPRKVLDSLRGKASERKLRLFACACCRRIRHVLCDERCRRAAEAVEVAESFADGLAPEAALAAAREAAQDVFTDHFGTLWLACGGEAAAMAAAADIRGKRTGHGPLSEGGGFGEAADAAAEAAAGYAADGPHAEGLPKAIVEGTWQAVQASERQHQARAVQCIFGNPFRPASAPAACRAPQVVALARGAYDDRLLPAGSLDPARLAVLADALEEAGCDQADILNHLRGPGPHVRGCWAVDLLLGKS